MGFFSISAVIKDCRRPGSWYLVTHDVAAIVTPRQAKEDITHDDKALVCPLSCPALVLSVMASPFQDAH